MREHIIGEALVVKHYREKLIAAFPPAPLFGEVSWHECDEGIALRQELPGKSWTEISEDFIDFYSGSVTLLTPAGLQAFLPAWLLRSTERLNDRNCVLAEFTMYFLCPGGSEEEGFDDHRIAKLIALFEGGQRYLVRDYLNLITSDSRLEDWHPYAEFGLRWWI